MKDRSLLRRLASGTLNYGAGSVLPKAIGFLLIPLYTVYLTPADYGVVDIVGSLAALLAVLMRLGLPGAVTRFYVQHKEGEALRDYVTTISIAINVSGVLVGLIAAVILLVAGERLAPGVAFWPFLVLGIVGAALTSNTDLQRRLIQAREQSAYSAKLSVVTAFATIILTIVFVAGFKLGALGMLLGSAVTSAFFFVQARAYLAPDLRGRFQRPLLKDSARYGIAILPGHLAGNLGPLVTRSVLAASDSLAAVGVFGLASRFANPLAVFAGAFSTAYVPVYFSLRQEGSEDARRRTASTAQMLWALSVALFIVTVIAGPPIVRMTTPEGYDTAGGVLVILALGFLAQVVHTVAGPELYYLKTPWIVPVLTAISTGVTVVLTLVFAKRYGAYGLAAAQTIASTLTAVLAGYASQRLFPLPHQWVNYAKVVAAAVVSVAVPVGLERLVTHVPPVIEVLLVLPSLCTYVFALWAMKHPSVHAARSLWDRAAGSWKS